MTQLNLKPGVVHEIALKHILPDADQIRQTFDEGTLQALADDIARRGIEQPITVRLPEGEAGANGHGYIVKHGERRRRAAALAGLRTVPVILAKAAHSDDAALDRLFDQYAENMQREDLNAMDMAFFYKRLRDEHQIKVREIPALLEARGLKKLNPKTVSNYIRNTTLPEWAQRYIQQGWLSGSHGKYLFLAMKSDKVLADIKHVIDSQIIKLKQGFDYSVRALRWDIYEAYQRYYPDISQNSDWERANFPERAVYYDYKTLSAEEKKALNIAFVPTQADGHITPFALNAGAHDRINETCKEKWDARHNPPAGADPTEEKKGRAGPAADRLKSYLHNWLKNWIAGQNRHART